LKRSGLSKYFEAKRNPEQIESVIFVCCDKPGNSLIESSSISHPIFLLIKKENNLKIQAFFLIFQML